MPCHAMPCHAMPGKHMPGQNDGGGGTRAMANKSPKNHELEVRQVVCVFCCWDRALSGGMRTLLPPHGLRAAPMQTEG